MRVFTGITRIYRNLQELQEFTEFTVTNKNFLINTSYKIVLATKILFTIARGSLSGVMTIYRNYKNLHEFTRFYSNLQEFSDQNFIQNIFDNQNIVYHHQRFDV